MRPGAPAAPGPAAPHPALKLPKQDERHSFSSTPWQGAWERAPPYCSSFHHLRRCSAPPRPAPQGCALAFALHFIALSKNSSPESFPAMTLGAAAARVPLPFASSPAHLACAPARSALGPSWRAARE